MNNFELASPNVYLFAFHLRDGKREDNPLWPKCARILHHFPNGEGIPPEIKSKLSFPDNLNVTRADLLKDIYLPFNSQVDFHNVPVEIDGFVQPLLLQDSYGFWLNVGCPEPDNGTTEDKDIQLLNKFNPDNSLLIFNNVPINFWLLLLEIDCLAGLLFLRDCLEFKSKFLGQTLLITGYLPFSRSTYSGEYLRQLADKCCDALLSSHSCPPFYRVGELFDSPIFEYGLTSQLSEYRHLLVWLFRDKHTDNLFDKYQQEIIDLLFYRNKIIKAFQDSRKVAAELIEKSDSLTEKIEKLQQQKSFSENKQLSPRQMQQLKYELKQLLKTSLDYNKLLRLLEDYYNTITINSYNYKERLQPIITHTEANSQDSSFLEDFSQNICPSFQAQIQGDLGYCQHGKELIEEASNTIRGLVEIDQAERDRRLERTVQVIGTGLAVGAIVASSSPNSLREEPILPPLASSTLHPFLFSFIVSFGAAIIAGIIAGLLGWLWTRCK